MEQVAINRGSATILPFARSDHPLRPGLAMMLASCDTEDLFAILGEILEPSFRGPLDHAYPADDQYEGFIEALMPVSQIYRHAYANIVREVRP